MTPSEKMIKLRKLIKEFSKTADEISDIWIELDTKNDDENAINLLLSQMIPTERSFDDLASEIREWKDDVLEFSCD